MTYGDFDLPSDSYGSSHCYSCGRNMHGALTCYRCNSGDDNLADTTPAWFMATDWYMRHQARTVEFKRNIDQINRQAKECVWHE